LQSVKFAPVSDGL